MPADFKKMHDFKPEQIGDLSGKVVLITGGNTGLGFQTIQHLAPHNATIIFTSRSQQKAENALVEIKKVSPNAQVSFIQMDLTSLASVQTAAREFSKTHSRLDILMTNAGIMNVPPALTKDGYELQFGTNHVGHALLIKLLLPLLLRTAEAPGSDVRVVSLASEASRYASNIDFKAVKTPMSSWMPAYGYVRYNQSKLANVLYAKQLAKRYPAIKSVSLHPGLVATDLILNRAWIGKKMVTLGASVVGERLLEPAEGALNQTWAATTARGELEDGQYYVPVAAVGKPTKAMGNVKLQEELWDWTQQEMKAWDL